MRTGMSVDQIRALDEDDYAILVAMVSGPSEPQDE